jgi:hypothetical protein
MNRPDWLLEVEVEEEQQPQLEGEGRRKMADRLLLLLVRGLTWTCIDTDNSAKGASAEQSISCETTAGKTVSMTASVSGYVSNICPL